MTSDRSYEIGTACRIRRASAADLPFLRRMLYEAAYWNPEMPRPDLERGLAGPDLEKLLAGWGRPGDTAVVAETGAAEPIGAAWYRFWTAGEHSHGYVNPETPEIGIGIVPAFRGHGVGRALMTRLLAEARRGGVPQVSLSVEVSNRRALVLYEKMGFQRIGQCGGSWTMVATFASPDTPPESGTGLLGGDRRQE